jgi:rSAM/selenodomain-associated transferase 1
MSGAHEASKVALIVLAKAPQPGRSKTRCCPPCSPVQAAELAEAALVDTLTAVARTRAARKVLVLDGPPDAWSTAAQEIVSQRGAGLDERLAWAFDDVGAPALLIGMDTPQVAPELLDAAMEALVADGVEAVLGLADDGGFWAVGLRRPDPQVFLGVPMSTERTGAVQLERLRRQAGRVVLLPTLTDVDTFDVALDVALQVPNGRFAAAVARITQCLTEDVVGAVARCGPAR